MTLPTIPPAGRQLRSPSTRRFLSRRAPVFAAAAVLVLAAVTPARAATLSWDPALTPTTPSGGAGTWDLNVTPNWSNGTIDQTWTDSTGTVDTAVFGGATAGTATLANSLGALGLVFQTTGYTVAPGTGPFALTLGAGGIDASTLTTGTTTISAATTLVSDQTWNVGTGAGLTAGGAVTGSFAVTKTGGGSVTLASGANAFGALNVNGGTVVLGSNVSFATGGAGTGAITLQGGGTLSNTYAAANTLNYSNAIVVPTGQTGTINTPIRFQLTGAVTGGGTLNMVITTNVSRADFRNTFNGFTGTLNLTGAGTIRLLINTTAPAFAANSFANTTLSVDGVAFAVTTNSGGNTLNVGALQSTGTAGNLGGGTAGAPTYSVGALNTSTTYSGSITGNSILTKVGTGTLTLGGVNSYTGVTNVSGGTLAVNGNAGAKLGNGNVSVLTAAVSLSIGTGVTNAISDAATLTLAGGGTAGVADNGYISLGAGVNETVAGLVLTGLGAQVAGTYGSSLSGATFQNDEYFSGPGVVSVIPVPEPSTWALVAVGMGMALGLPRIRRRRC